MSEINHERRCYEAAKRALARDGITRPCCVMVLFAMLLEDMSYVEAVKAYAEHIDNGWDAVRWHNEICRHTLRAWITESPGLYFDRKVEEIREHG